MNTFTLSLPLLALVALLASAVGQGTPPESVLPESVALVARLRANDRLRRIATASLAAQPAATPSPARTQTCPRCTARP